MSILRVANVHFQSSGSNRIDYVGDDNIIRVSSGALRLPVGSTSGRPTGEEGLIRYNSETGTFEGRNATAWGAIAGSGSQTSFTTNTIFTITDNTNAAVNIIQLGTADALRVAGKANIDSLGVGTPASGVLGEIRAANNITAYYSSDIRLKNNIVEISDALSKVNQIRGVEFDWTDEYIASHGGEDGYFVRKHDIGVIAQEIEKVLPEVVAKRNDGIKAVKYDRIVALLIEAVKELSREVEELKGK